VRASALLLDTALWPSYRSCEWKYMPYAYHHPLPPRPRLMVRKFYLTLKCLIGAAQLHPPLFFLRLSHSNALYLSFEPSLHRTSKTAALCNSACRSAEAQTRSINIISTYANTGTGRWSSIHSLPRLSGIEMSNYYQSGARIIEAVHEHERSGLELTTSS
jgi:hypothetical protein